MISPAPAPNPVPKLDLSVPYICLIARGEKLDIYLNETMLSKFDAVAIASQAVVHLLKIYYDSVKSNLIGLDGKPIMKGGSG